MSSSFPAFSLPPRVELPTQVDEGARVLVVDDSPTILKVVTAILQRHGYEVTTARDGAEALSHVRAEPFDLVLLDFAMPKMNGYQFCRELRAEPELADLPVVLMSARTPVIGERFVEQTGAVDALSKPFDARALVAVVGGVIAKRKLGDTQRRQLPEPDQMIDEAELDAVASSIPPASRHARAAGKLADQIATAIQPQLRSLRPTDLLQPMLVEDAVRAALSDEAALAQIARAVDDMDLPEGTGIVLRGDVALLPLAELLQLFQLRRQAGVLKVQKGHKAMAMALSDGNVDMVMARACGDTFRLGRYFVRLGLLSREQLDAQVDACGGKMVIGQWLLEKGLVEKDQLEQALALQTAELTYELIRWTKGRFTLLDEQPWPEATMAKLGLGLSELVLEGFRRVDEWRLMADTIDFDAVCVVDRVALEAVARKLGESEQRVLGAIDGERTVREIMETTELASFDVIRIFYRFLETRIVRKK